MRWRRTHSPGRPATGAQPEGRTSPCLGRLAGPPPGGDRRARPGWTGEGLMITPLAQCHAGEPGNSPDKLRARRPPAPGAAAGGAAAGIPESVAAPPSRSAGRPARAADGCRPPGHLGVVPDGRAGARRVTVERRRAPGGSSGAGGRSGQACSARWRALPRGRRSGRAVRTRGAGGRPPGGVPPRRRSGPERSTSGLVSVRRCPVPPGGASCHGVTGGPQRFDTTTHDRPRHARPDKERPTTTADEAGPTTHYRGDSRQTTHDRSDSRQTTHDRRRSMRIHPRQLKPSRPTARSKAVTRGTR